MSRWKPDIYSYLSYRLYLRDYYQAAKGHVEGFSYRYLSKQAGFSSTNFLKLVMDGQRNLGEDSIDRVCRALELKAGQARFFADLVAFEQAGDHRSKNEAFERVMASRRFREARFIDQGMYQYLSHWYYPAIREMVARADFREDPVWIAGQLLPAITPHQAGQALELLQRLGLVVRDEESGRLLRGEAGVSAGHEVATLAARNFHRQMLERASESMLLVPRERRDLSALTVCISPETAQELKEEIHRLRERMMERCDRDETPSEVYQINIQLFPLTVSAEGEEVP